MLARVGAFTVRRRRAVVISAVVGLIIAGVLGGTVVKKLSTGGFTDPNSESARAERTLLQTFHFGNPNLVFGSAVAAGLPLIVAILAVVGTLLVLRIISAVTDVSIFSLNITTGLGIGLGIDYALFIVSRYREEVRAGRSVEAAVVRTVETAGRTVLFSAVTVAVSLSALLVFPLFFLRSFAYAGIAVVAIAATGAIVVLPAVLASLGPRVEKFVLWHHTPRPVGEGAWHRIALFVMRRPVWVGLTVVALLLALGAPFLGVKFGLPDDRVLPPGSSTRLIQDQIRHNVSSGEASALSIVAAR